MALSIPTTSLQWVTFPITADLDPTAWPIEVAVGPVEPDEPDTGWVAAEWDGAAVERCDRFEAVGRFLSGPGGDIEPDEGRVKLWARVTTPDETPVIEIGILVYT